MSFPIEPKYGVQFLLGEMRVVKNATGEVAPKDEPLILFRGRDRLALPLLKAYRELRVTDGCTAYHLNGIDSCIAEFEKFAAESPTMKQPGITEGR